MASGITPFAAALLLNRLLRGVDGAWPATGYVALGLGGFSDSTTTGELTGGQYARQSISLALGTSGFNVISGGLTSNIVTLNYGTASANHGLVTQWSMWDSLTTGNMLVWADLIVSQTVTSGNPYAFAGGNPGSMVIGAV